MTTTTMFFNRLSAVLAGVMLVSGAAFAQTGVSTDVEITVTNSASPQGVRTLHFGVDPAATNGIDNEGTCEDFFPPFPPTATFEARFVNQGVSDLGEGSPCDFRPFSSPPQKDEYKIRMQPGNNGLPIHLSWDMEYVKGHYASAMLTDPFGGAIVSVDMRSASSLDVTNSALSELLIVAEGPGSAPSGVDEGVAGAGFRLESLPNPIAGRTTISYTLPNAAGITLTLNDVNGREVMRLLDGVHQVPGDHAILFDADALPAGAYFSTLTVDGASTTRRLVRVR